MSELWVAEHGGMKARVAVKFLSPELLQDAVTVERFEREAKAAARVHSPHVVQYFEHGVCEHGPYLVMELLDGEDLASRLRRGPLSLHETAQVLAQMSRALQKVHAKGIVHRDIKPENIFLVDVGGPEIFCKLIDFGVAKGRYDSAPTMNKTATGSLLGTPYYMSPEQAVNARDADFRTDLWALGMVVFEAMVGHRALQVDGLGAMVLALHTAELPRPSDENPAIPAAVDAWFQRACAREPEDRFSSAKAMAESFLEAIAAPATSTDFALDTPLPPAPQVPSLLPFRHRVPEAAEAEPEPAPAPAPKVPTLRPPPPSPRKAPRAQDESWMHLIDRSNLTNPAAEHSLPPPSPRGPPLQGAPVPPEGQRPSLVLWLIAAALGLLLFVGLSVLVQGSSALRVLFPGLYPSPSASAPRP
jgi:serine/threonine-protein kinase